MVARVLVTDGASEADRRIVRVDDGVDDGVGSEEDADGRRRSLGLETALEIALQRQPIALQRSPVP